MTIKKSKKIDLKNKGLNLGKTPLKMDNKSHQKI